MTTDLVAQLRDLAPWHFAIDLGNGANTTDGNQAKFGDKEKWPIGVVNPRELKPLLSAVYPDGLAGKRFLDVACNGGGYSMLAREMGAEYALGYDAREHWINQASFVARHLGLQPNVEFRVDDAGTFSSEVPFDITLFKEIFYHLPDPVHALRRAADVTREVIIVDTETGGQAGQFALKLKMEPQKHNLMTGVDGVAWWPSGPDLIEALLAWLGFEGTRTIYWRPKRGKNRTVATEGRCRVIGARSAAMLERITPELIQQWERARKPLPQATAA